MYELSIALRYLIPKKRALSTSLISILSFVVISLVVWLALVFLSVSSGLEENWLNKLTTINAPVKITPTPKYYSSYYYLIDSISSSSDFETKTIAEKINSSNSHPYLKDVDPQVPLFWPNPLQNQDGSFKDLVKELIFSLQEIKKKNSNITYQDFEMSGAFLRLFLNQESTANTSLSSSFLSQMSYLISFQEKNPHLKDLIAPITVEDLNHLLRTSEHSNRLANFLEHVDIERVKTRRKFSPPLSLLSENIAYSVQVNNALNTCFLLSQKQGNDTLKRKGNDLFLNGEKRNVRLFFEKPITFSVDQKEKGQLLVQATFQNTSLKGKISLQDLSLVKAKAKVYFSKEPSNPPCWAYFTKQKGWNLPKDGVVLPKSYKSKGVLLGDQGYLSYNSMSGSSPQEQRLLFQTAGFYDPGAIPVGNRFLFVPKEMIRTINSTSSLLMTDTSTNGIMLWTTPIQKAKQIQVQLQEKLKENNLDEYFRVETYQDYDFSKNLLEQFQSDKLLFTLIALIIMIVACSNIISMLLLLVNDKRKEIAILTSMGSSRLSIAFIFGFCGFITGLLSTVTGVIGAIFTLRHLDVLSSFLSSILGHEAFNTAFFGENLPNTLSMSALLFILIVTPILSLFAGVIPAMKAMHLKPSYHLRSQ